VFVEIRVFLIEFNAFRRMRSYNSGCGGEEAEEEDKDR